MIKNSFLVLFLFLVLFSFNGYSQHEISAKRPKIGVVLSGGGAKGIAHIGILKALELEGLRPDYIAGTSMGSIIGGLYALGYTADQLDTIIRSVNWDLVLSNNIPLEYIAYEEKEYYTRYLFEFPFKEGTVKLPSGMIQGQMLGEVLSRFTWPAKNYRSFDEFPIPFRCVGTDVSTGKPVVFKDGSLANALRASMAIPTVFTAVDLDTTLAVDGGVVNNFPVEELYNMGAEYVIGVNVTHGFQSAYEIESMTGILLQIAMIPSSEKLESQIKLCDIYIEPDLENYSTGSFGSYAEILKLGYLSGEKFRPRFREVADSIGQNNNPPPNIALEADSIIIGSIKITGNRLVEENLIFSKLQIEAGDKVSIKEIEEGIRTIHGITSFKKVDYQLSPLPEPGHYELTVSALENNPVTLKGAIHYDNIFKIGITGNLTLRNILGKSSRAIIAADISENPKLRLNYLKYIGNRQGYAGNFTYNYLNEQIPSYEEGQVKDVDVTREHLVNLGLITTQSLKSSIYAGIAFQNLRQKQKFFTEIPEGIKQGIFNFSRAEFLFTSNTFNDRNYPVSGRELSAGGLLYFYNTYKIVFEKDVDTVFLTVNAEGIPFHIPFTEDQLNQYIVDPQVPDPYFMIHFSYKKFVRVGDKFQVIPGFDAGFTLSTDTMVLFDEFRIGGFQRVRFNDIRFLGLNYYEVDYPNYAIASLVFQNVLFKKIFLKYGANLLLPYDHVPLDDLGQFNMNTLLKDNSIFGYGVEATLKSMLGPISLGISSNARDNFLRYYVAIGFSFNYND